jgi:hypothetical protein
MDNLDDLALVKTAMRGFVAAYAFFLRKSRAEPGFFKVVEMISGY